MKVAVYGRQLSQILIPYVEELFTELDNAGFEVVVYEPFYNSIKQLSSSSYKYQSFTSAHEIKGKIDILFSVGGDGTILDTLSLVQESGNNTYIVKGYYGI